jgi:outer membrane receptor protein involved in Fe transport
MGFSKLEQRDVQVTVGRVVTLRLALQPGEVTAVVTVEDTPLIDATRTDESTLISREQINDLPINGRRADQFALLAPGVMRDGRFGLLSYRGQSGVFNNFTLEGNDDNQAYFGEARGRTRIASNISANAIQEFQVLTSGFLPEFGRSAGGINAVVRSGGNEFRGDAFWYFRNEQLNARDPLASFRPDERRDQFGGSLSGPIVKDKLFFFVNYDQQIRNFPLVTNASPDLFVYPTGTGIPARTAVIPGRTETFQQAFDRAVADLQSRFPNGQPGSALPRTADQNLLLAKVDWNINDKNTLSATYNYLNARGVNAIQTPIVLDNVGRNGSDDVRINSFNTRLTTIFTPKLINEFRFQVSRDFEFQFGNEPPPQVFVGPRFSFGRANFLERPALPDERKVQFVNNFSIIAGDHQIKIGGDILYTDDFINNPSNDGGTYNYANSLFYGVDLIDPTRRSYNSFTQSFGLPEGFSFSTTDFSLFVQDQWRLRSNVTINYGLRYEFQRLPEAVAPNPAIPETKTLSQDTTNFGPRIGAAWDIFGNNKTVLRGNWGLYYARTPNGTIFNTLTQTGLTDPNLARISISINPTAPNAPVYPNILTTLPAVSTPNAFRLDPEFKRPRLQDSKIGIEHEFFSNFTVSASFLYTKGDRLPVNIDSNLPVPGTATSAAIAGRTVPVSFN